MHGQSQQQTKAEQLKELIDMSQNIQSVKINSDAFDIQPDHKQKKDLNHLNQILESHLISNMAQNH